MTNLQVGDEVVFLTDSYNNGIKFTITKIFNHGDSYEIVNNIAVLRKKSDLLYWIPAGTQERPKGE